MSALTVDRVRVAFGGNVVLDEVSLAAERGEVTGLIGPNGAGKTTLFNVISGFETPQQGSVRLGDVDVTRLNPAKRARRGLGRTFQRLELFTMLSVAENVAVAVETHRSSTRRSVDRSIDRARNVKTRTTELLEMVGVADRADDRVTALPTGQARLVELARALAAEPSVLLLDEPASGQSDTETRVFGELLGILADGGLAVLLVEHDVRLVMECCHVVHVLDRGRLLASGSPDAIRADADVRAAYLGMPSVGEPAVPRGAAANGPRVAAGTKTPQSVGSPPPVLALRGIHAAYEGIDVLHGINLTVRQGTVHAVLGPNGAGKTTLLKVAAGVHPPSRGTVTLAGHRIDGLATDALARAGVCLIPEGRGIFPNLTVAENLWMVTGRSGDRATVSERFFDRFTALADRRGQRAGTLSGGEQQMLALARALVTDPAIVLIDELSMGLAPLVVEELYELVAQVAVAGTTILLVEQFAHAALAVASEVTLLAHGSVVGTEAVGMDATGVLDERLTEAYLGG